MIEEKECANKDCTKGDNNTPKKFHGTKRAKFCCANCRIINWRKKS